MAADYDLVVLGGGLEGRIAATIAVGYGARVALVEPPDLFEDGQRQQWLLAGLQQLGQVLQRQAVGERFGWAKVEGELSWPQLLAWSEIAAESQSVSYSAAVMSARGVDVVLERPEFLSRRMAVTTKTRQLRARGVLVACGTVPAATSLLERSALPKFANVVGGSVMAIAWAEALAAVGVAVRLIAQQVMPEADADVRRIVRSQLIAAGIEIAPVCEEDWLVLKIDPSKPVLTLPGFVRASGSRLRVNRKLQTSHSRLFACGAVLGGSTNARLAECEARVAVINALFLPVKRVDYGSTVRGYGRYACVGLTQAAATARYGDEVRVQTASDANSADLSRVGPLPTYCKLVCAGDRLVGVHLIGEGAEGLACLLAKRLGQSVSGLDGGSLSSRDLVDLAFEGGGRSRQSRWQIGHWRRDWAENWFNWRRSR